MKITITLIAAQNLAAKDMSGTSDPYIEVKLQNNEEKVLYKSKKIMKNLNPKWSESFTIDGDKNSVIIFDLFDWDRFSKDDFLGRVCVSIADIINDENYQGQNVIDVSRWADLEKRSKKDKGIQGALNFSVLFGKPKLKSNNDNNKGLEGSNSGEIDYKKAYEEMMKKNKDLEEENDHLKALNEQQKKQLENFEKRMKALRQEYLNSKIGKEMNRVSVMVKQNDRSNNNENNNNNEQVVEEDNELTEGERQQKELEDNAAYSLFQIYDINGDNVIDKWEFRTLLNELRWSKQLTPMNERLFEKFVEMNWKNLDENDDGSISFPEFEEFLNGGSSAGLLTKGLHDSMKLKFNESKEKIIRKKKKGSSSLIPK
eukprot:TRINITY_DN1723_c0_g1_i2.p1 TRINITY_DN1723_c0_g1~~TRINITY_DN1723_c0_g1_i2.p1  ORF type:complete len:371 (-),score=131.29 TRINITY_DN1723_c0_g1_i2:107-1219(-)